MLSSILAVLAMTAVPAAGDTALIPMKEIIVTGSRVSEPALRAPAAVTVVDRSKFQDTRQFGLDEALSGIPGVFVQSRAGGQDVRVTIRGYGARGNGERSNSGSVRGIRVLTDGVPVTEPDGRTSLDLVDLGSTGRIEVVRSNASVLYGNASGGVVNLRTNLSFERPWLEYTESGGSYGFHREQAAAGFTLGESRGVFTLANTTFDGWREHSSAASTIASLRLTVPLDGGTRLGFLADGVGNLTRYPGALTAAQLTADPAQANSSFVTRDERRRNRVGRIAATLDRESGQNTISSAVWVEPKVLQRSERNRYRDFTRYHVGGNGVWSRTWQAGGAIARTTIGGDEDWQDGAILFYALGPGGSKSATVVANKREGANSAGIFAQQMFSWTRWSAQISARYDNLWYISQDNITPLLNDTRHFSRTTPKGTVSYGLESHTIYAALGGGVESPAFNEIDPPPPYDALTSLNPFLDPMVSTTWELGMRGAESSRRGSIRYDAALYRIEVKHDIVPYGGGAYFFTAGRTRRQGAELALEWQPAPALSLSGAVSVSSNEYLEYRNDLGTFDGNNVAGLPALLASAMARYRFGAGVSAQAGVSGNGRYFADDANTASTIQFGVLDATLSWDRPIARGSLRAFVQGRNLLNKEYVSSVFINGISGQYFEAGLPLNMNAGVSLRWQ